LRAQGLRPVVIWLPDPNDAAYRAELAAECQKLASLTEDEKAMADAFEANAGMVEGWR
jgi:hypothetical protein